MEKNILILLSVFTPCFLFNKALVLENVRAAAGCAAAVTTGPGTIAGRANVCEMGILKTFAREARTGERGRMVGVVGFFNGGMVGEWLDVGRWTPAEIVSSLEIEKVGVGREGRGRFGFAARLEAGGPRLV